MPDNPAAVSVAKPREVINPADVPGVMATVQLVRTKVALAVVLLESIETTVGVVQVPPLSAVDRLVNCNDPSQMAVALEFRKSKTSRVRRTLRVALPQSVTLMPEVSGVWPDAATR
jgi:hypothetical protein